MAAGEIEDGPRVLGIGVGLFLLILLWSFTLFIILVITRVSSVFGMLLTSFSVIISAIMLAIPRHPPVFKDRQPAAATEDEIEDFRIYDYMMVWKILFVIIMALVALGGSLSFFVSHCVSQIYAQPVKKLKIQQ